MTQIEKTIKKLRTPPAAHNWVKNIRPRRDDTARALHNFAINPPRSSLRQATRILAQIVIDGISLEEALECASLIKDAKGADRAQHIIRAFHPYARARGWKGVEVFAEMVEYYPTKANVRIPVRPTFVLNIDGRLVPYFVVCWSKMDLTMDQKRILSTLIGEAILSLEEFQRSDAVIICTPKHAYSKVQREVSEWPASQYPVLDAEEKQELFDRYVAAQGDAERMIIDSLS